MGVHRNKKLVLKKDFFHLRIYGGTQEQKFNFTKKNFEKSYQWECTGKKIKKFLHIFFPAV